MNTKRVEKVIQHYSQECTRPVQNISNYIEQLKNWFYGTDITQQSILQETLLCTQNQALTHWVMQSDIMELVLLYFFFYCVSIASTKTKQVDYSHLTQSFFLINHHIIHICQLPLHSSIRTLQLVVFPKAKMTIEILQTRLKRTKKCS